MNDSVAAFDRESSIEVYRKTSATLAKRAARY